MRWAAGRRGGGEAILHPLGVTAGPRRAGHDEPVRTESRRQSSGAGALVLPLALAQFIASYAATNMNVAISAIATDLGTTVIGLQTAITLFTLTMASLMIPGSKLTDIWGRKTCFVAGLSVYGTGALLAAAAPGLGVLIAGYSVLEGVGSALMIPPVYILITVAFPDVTARARYFGVVSGAGGLGAAAGPLIGGLVTSATSWRVSFLLQVGVVAWIIVLARRIADPPRTGPAPGFDTEGAIVSAAGLFFIVLGILQSGTYGWLTSREDFTVGGTVVIAKGGVSPVWLFIGLGALILLWFFLHIASRERHGREPLLHLRLFRDRTANLGLGTQFIQWLVLQGSFFVVSVYLQEVWKYNAIATGLMLTPATLGILLSSAAAGRLARRRPQRTLIIAGFAATIAGMALVLGLVRKDSGIASFVPGLLLMGGGVGVMLTSSVNVVQSSFPDADQGDISGLSRSVSNLGSSFGTALVGSVLVAARLPEGKPFALALSVLVCFALIGLGIAIAVPRPPAGQHGTAALRSIRAPGDGPRLRRRTAASADWCAMMKYVLFYTSGSDIATKAPLHAAERRARWATYRDRGSLMMIGPFADGAGAMGVFTTRDAAEEFAREDPPGWPPRPSPPAPRVPAARGGPVACRGRGPARGSPPRGRQGPLRRRRVRVEPLAADPAVEHVVADPGGDQRVTRPRTRVPDHVVEPFGVDDQLHARVEHEAGLGRGVILVLAEDEHRPAGRVVQLEP
jgi:MFS family permease